MGFFTSTEVDQKVSPFYDQDLTNTYLQFIRQQLGNKQENGGYELQPMQYFDPADTSRKSGGGTGIGDALGMAVKPNDNLQKAWGAWQPWDGGSSYTANYITNNAGPDPTIAGLLNNVQQYGGPGGYGTELMHNMAQQGGAGAYPTGLMHNMAQYGGTGGVGNNAMSLAMQYGAPSAAGQYASNMAQYGIASNGSGAPLANRAYGKQTAAMDYLAPFMAGKGRQYANPIQYAPPQLPGIPQMAAYQAPSRQV